ncbi:hypothetical protein SmJEL517_g03902 [Synchytrium microbalum]|uniref:Dynein regulatory complex protein 1/2 N-terminal domain-containing protein n=1 Tax=Synchytrium microbalum TaxID=1806994 RepID=A0A507C1Z5_9FUNG|nr:uncharacterized protein SmJEL517_g03902 [Synchytrium microbalum]TPX33079.1 hypothetical protein SmJEL517_g03902 [Synchytrium microbalum]
MSDAADASSDSDSVSPRTPSEPSEASNEQPQQQPRKSEVANEAPAPQAQPAEEEVDEEDQEDPESPKPEDASAPASAGPNKQASTSATPSPAKPTVAEPAANHGLEPLDPEREARISARRVRVDAARAARAAAEHVDEEAPARLKVKQEHGSTILTKNNMGKGKAQIDASRRKIQLERTGGMELVTNVRVGVVSREASRRAEAERRLSKWVQSDKIAQMSAQDAGLDEHVEDKIGISKGPYALFELLKQQESACDRIIAAKDRLITEYVAEMKARDDEYVKELKQEAEEIDTLLERMEQQYQTFRGTLREESEKIERALVQSQHEMIDENSKEIEGLLEARRSAERNNMDERAIRVDSNLNELENLRTSDSEEYNVVKIKLETDVQVLEQQLQQMRATYQLNTEKLEYNYQVLKKRDEENGTILSAQKRKITRLTDHVNALKSKIAKAERGYAHEQLVLNDDQARITEQLQELARKFRHFQLADQKKYKEVWAMNESVASDLVNKLLQADQIIHEQQLGNTWKPPQESADVVNKSIDPMMLDMMNYSNNNNPYNKNGPGNNKQEDAIALIPRHNSLCIQLHNTAQQDKIFVPSQISDALRLFVSECSFLIDERLIPLIAPLPKQEQDDTLADAVLHALGCKSVDDALAFVTALVDAKGALIDPSQVVTSIKRVLNERKGLVQRHKSNGSVVGDNESVVDDSIEEHSVARVDPKHDPHRAYWERMSNVVDEKGFRVWTAVHVVMERYNTLLSERSCLVHDIDHLQRQNEELSKLLKDYMTAPINESLCVPPTHIMLAQAQASMKSASQQRQQQLGGLISTKPLGR